MKERKRRQSLGGAVLIMVLTVMFILMILLMATLTTVTTANQRIFTKYEENQAYYTARSALDVFTQNMIADGNYLTAVDYDYSKADGTADKVKMKQGLELQLDLYAMKAHAAGNNITQKALKDYVTSGATPADQKKKEYEKYYGIDSTVEVTQRMNNGKSSTAADYDEWDLMTYKVMLPKTSNSSTYGRLADSEEATITIEILDRSYDIGGYAIPATYADKDEFFAKASDAAKAEAFVTGNRKKDTMRIKITAKTMFAGVEGTAVLIIDSSEPPANNSSRALTAFGGTGSDNMSILGGMSAENTINWGSNDGFIYGPVYVEDDFLMTSNGPKIYLDSGENLVVGGDMQLANSGHFQVTNTTSPVIVDDENAPFVYVGGELRIVSDIEKPFLNVDVIAETFTASAKVTLDSTNRIYCKGFTSNCGSNSEYNGDIYVDGNVTIFSDNDTKIVYDYSTTPPTPMSVVHGGTGTIHFTGEIIDGSTGNFVTSLAGAGFVKETTHFWNDIPKPSQIAESNPAVVAGNDNKKIEFKLPGRTNKKRIETHTQNFDTYYVKDADGNRVMITVTDPVTGNPVQKPQVKSAQVMADIDTMADKTKPFTSANTGITTALSSLTTSGGNIYGVNFNHVLDTGGSDVKAVWNFDNQNIYIKGGGTVVLQLDETKSWGYGNDNIILVDDDTTLKIIGDLDSVGTGPWSDTFTKLKVYNQTTYAAYENINAGAGVDALKVGSKSGVGIKVPKIFYYFTGSNKFSVQTNCLLTGYIYAPDTEINFPAAGNNPPKAGLQYNGNTITDPNTKVCVVGSALVKGANIPNNQGVAYINPELDQEIPGNPIHQWKSFQYVRS